MSEEKKLTDEEIVKALEHCATENTCRGCVKYNGEPMIYYFKCMRDTRKKVVDLFQRLQAENERLKINLANEKKWGKIQAKQTEKDTARKILGELDLFFKGTTFRQGYEFKKIDEKLKEMAKRYDVGVDYEN